jgi:hypothetical protein
MTMNQEKTIETNWMLDEQNRLLSRGLIVFRYTESAKAEAGEWSPIKWEKLLPSGLFVEITDADQIKDLNNALRPRLAIAEDPKARQALSR